MATAITPLQIHLDAPLKWTEANPDELKMLRALQGNILKGHGRKCTANIVVTFGSDKPGSKRLLRDLANHRVTDAHEQLLEAKVYKATGKPGGDFCHVALSFAGYQALGMSGSAPNDPDFKLGMRDSASLKALGDPVVAQWEPAFRDHPLHAIVLAASETEAGCARLAGGLIEQIEEAGAIVRHVQHGKQLMSAADEGIEHFGYVDGRSQPLMLVEDIVDEAGAAGTSIWDPAFALDIALVPDVGVIDARKRGYSFGSYFIFRKLEQNVRGFKKREMDLADALGLKGSGARELAGAMVVGRFEDGTPVTLSATPRTDAPPHDQKPPNDFNYDGDAGTRCPFHSHIRKTNPRGSGGVPGGEADERTRLMARRGITYEDTRRPVHPEELPEAEDSLQFDAKVAHLLPTGGAGLLFMAYNSVIAKQFKFTQQSWANSDGFPLGKPDKKNGIDPVIGQAGSAGAQRTPKVWDDAGKGTDATTPFSGFVTMKGGEYLFSPSLTFLKSL